MADVTVQTNLTATVAPNLNDDSGDGYSIFSPWVDITADRIYWAMDVTVGAAVWYAPLKDVVQDLTPQLGGMLDVNGFALGNGIQELVKFVETVSAVNEITITNAATGSAPKISASGDDTDVKLFIEGQGSGDVILQQGGSGNVSVGTITPDRRFHVEEDSAATSTVTQLARFTSTSSGIPANGIGVGLEFEVETAAGNNEIGATIEVVATDVDPANEDFDIVFKTMLSGDTAAEAMRITSDGLLQATLFAGGANDQLVTDDGSGGLVSESGLVFDGTNLGIGTASPDDTLTVAGGINFESASGVDLSNKGVRIRQSGADSTAVLILSGTRGVWVNAETNSGTGDVFAVYSGGAVPSEVFRVTGTNGRVGINDTNPGAQLDITAATSTVGLNIDLDATPGDAFTVTDSGASTLLVIDGTGNVSIGAVTANSGLEMGNDKLLAKDVNTGLTAGTTQTQAGGLALTAQVNEVATVANTSDTVVLPSLPATGSLEIEIINNGANTMRVFPASGDNLGAGVNLADAVNIPTGTVRKYISYDATNWTKYISE